MTPAPELDLSRLPAVTRRIVRALGPQLALALFELRGGTQIQLRALASGRFSTNYADVAELLGHDGTRRLAEAFPGRTEISLPMPDKLLAQARDAEIQRRLAEGESTAELARAYHVTRRWVQRIGRSSPASIADAPCAAADRQGDLFAS